MEIEHLEEVGGERARVSCALDEERRIRAAAQARQNNIGRGQYKAMYFGKLIRLLA